MRKKLNFIQSLARGLTVLQAFSGLRPRLTLSEIAQITGLNVTAAQRFSDTLMQLGYLHRDEHRRFSLGPKVLTLGFAYLNGSQLKQLAEGFLDEFAARLNRTTNLGILVEDYVIFIHRRESQRFLKYDLHTGSKVPSHCTATGKVLLAGLPDDRLRSMLTTMELTPITSQTITDPGVLWDDLMATRERGYSVSDREMDLALLSLGTPILDQEGKVIAAVNLSLSVEEAEGEVFDEMLAQLQALGRDLSQSLGYQGTYPLIRPPAAEGGAS